MSTTGNLFSLVVLAVKKSFIISHLGHNETATTLNRPFNSTNKIAQENKSTAKVSNQQTLLSVRITSSSHFTPVTHDVAKDAFVDNVERAKHHDDIPNMTSIKLFRCPEAQNNRQTGLLLRISLTSFHNERNHLRKIVLQLHKQLQLSEDELQKICTYC